MTAPILPALEALPRARGGRAGRWTACCPAHEDRNPSLGWTVGDDGRVLLRCHAGCRAEDVVGALGASMSDLFEPEKRGVRLVPAKPAAGPAAKTRRFDCVDADGRRWDHFRSEDDAGRKVRVWWQSGAPVARMQPYGAEALPPGAGTVVLVEGEAAAEGLLANGVAAVGTFGTDYRPVTEALLSLRGRRVILWPDADADPAKGRAHMLDMARRLDGLAGSVAWVEPPADVFDGWDAADADAWTAGELLAAAGQVPGVHAEPTVLELTGARVLSDIAPEPPAPLLVGRIHPKAHTILYGTGGSRKGTLCAAWIVELVKLGQRVMVADYEDHPDEWRGRVGSLGGAAPLTEVLHVAPLSPAWKGVRGPLWAQAPDLRRLAEAWGATLLVVDSIVVACGGSDPMDPGTPARYAAALQEIGVPALSLAHVSKEGGLAYPFGSVFWHNLARATWSLELDGTGAMSILASRKVNEGERKGRFVVDVTYRDGLPGEVAERSYAAVLADRVAAALEDGPASVPAIVDRLNEDAGEGPGVKADSVRHVLRRGLGDQRFAVDGKDKGQTWSIRR